MRLSLWRLHVFVGGCWTLLQFAVEHCYASKFFQINLPVIGYVKGSSEYSDKQVDVLPSKNHALYKLTIVN